MGFTPPTGVSSVTLPKTSIPCVPYLRISWARPGRLRPVVLEDDAAHAPLLRELRHLERVPLPGVAVGSMVRVKVDGAGKRGIRELLVDGRLRISSLVRLPVRLGGRLRQKWPNRNGGSRPRPSGRARRRSEVALSHHQVLGTLRPVQPHARTAAAGSRGSSCWSRDTACTGRSPASSVRGRVR